jgi:hypothetical protein
LINTPWLMFHSLIVLSSEPLAKMSLLSTVLILDWIIQLESTGSDESPLIKQKIYVVAKFPFLTLPLS